jgi:hypothetical protein
MRSLFPLLASFLLASCTAIAAPTSNLPEGNVTISTGQIPLMGTVYGHGGTAVILASRGGYPDSEWSSVARDLAGDGFTALTIPSPEDENSAVSNVREAIDFLGNNGYEKILCAGASMGASGCAYNAGKPGMIGIVLLTYHGAARLKSSTIPKLFIAAGLDNIYRPLTEAGYRAAGEPKYLIIVENSGQLGAEMLDAPEQDLRDTLVRFLKSCPDGSFSP